MYTYLRMCTYIHETCIEINEEMREERQEKESFYFSDT